MIPNVTGDSLPGPLSDEMAKTEQSMDSWSRVGFSFLPLWAAAKGRRPPSSFPPSLRSPVSFRLPAWSCFFPGGQGPLRMGICTGVEYSCALLPYTSLDYVAILYDLACVALGAECFYSIPLGAWIM